MKVSVLGLGYIGLPTSLLIANENYHVVGIDINPRVVKTLNEGKLPFEESGLKSLFKNAKNNFKASTKLETSDIYIIAVPTPLDKDLKIANISYV